MPKYSYRAINKQGRPVRGVINAANEADLFNRLQEVQMSLLDCKAMTDRSNKLKAITAPRIKVRDLIQMFIQFEQLQKAGVPLLDALTDIRDTADSPRLRDIMGDVYSEVSSGASFSSALAQHPGTFEPIFVSLINSGEETGNLTNSFTQVIRHLKWNDAMNTKVKKATRYPKILMTVVVGVVWLMMGFVVPEVIGFLRNIGQELPPQTTALIATSDFFAEYSIHMVVLLVSVIAFIRIARNVSESFRYHTDYLILRLPVLGMVTRKIALSRFCATFAVLFTSGLEILKCLDAARMTSDNLVITEALSNVRQQVQEGSPLSHALANSGEFPSLVVRMVRIGEESGNLTGVLEQVAEFYDKDVNEAVDAMIQMIEPTLTAFLGAMLLWIAAAVFGPVYDSFSNMG